MTMTDAGFLPAQETKPEKNEFTIGELAREFGLTLRALRFYEDKGLLSPQRDGLKRIYSRTDRTRLRLIKEGKGLGFTITEIKPMLGEQGSEPGCIIDNLPADQCKRLQDLFQKEVERAEFQLGRIRVRMCNLDKQAG